MTQNQEPEPVDESGPGPEIRGGNHAFEWLNSVPGWTEADGEFTGVFEKDGCPGHGEDDPDEQ